MNYPLFALGLGFLLGLKHATEADHLVAVTTIVSEQRSVARSALVGAMWGVGHTAALLAAGILVILLQVAIPERVAAALEFCVALMIVFLGGRVLFLALRNRRRVHVHAHTHDGHTHTHLHFHEHADEHAPAAAQTPSHERHAGLRGWRSVFVGVVHGLAGSAVLTLFVLTEVVKDGSRALGLAYLLIFGLGSVGGMMLMSALISLPFVFTSSRFTRVDAPVRLLTGSVSVAFGLYYAWETARGI
jgi:ABC-type nickel/cobalt efflux system permease component RcnA